MSDSPVLSCQQLSKQFTEGKLQVKVFNDINLSINAQDNIAIIGASGAGKSSLLHILGGLDRPSQGQVQLMGQNLHELNELQRCLLRNQHLGFVYQFHHLLPEFTALENVCMPLLIAGMSIKTARERALEMINKMGLSSRAEHKPAELSGGEKQRIAIARALVTEPSCVLADEPTGNLDNHTANQVFDELLRMNQALKTSLIIVTHDQHIAKKMAKCYELRDGELVAL